ncbi:hypothetical protein L6R53_28285 [Myxococcota bacterium]|nr:hypothetical protein [Myxococcota bacterium]
MAALDLHGTVVTAALGPTNTGKTHSAIQRMLGHRTGMIGLPLRLLAREVYDRVVAQRGPEVVALVTGEERIEPPGARYWVCTVEAMPVEKPVAFVAVDEVQLCAHPARGHVFTDRLLHARGTVETMLLGADTMARAIQDLLPLAEVVARPRLSTLRHKGPHRLTSLPPRSAVVAFSANRVYELAERLRRRHGGTAVVLGALSPRTRNAQVALYQSGEVPYLVATDAIGMGLNLDVDHVAFSALTKFDGRVVRELHADELAQIAGRAGRYKRDGTFGTLDETGALPADVIEAIEQHRFPPVRRLWWRNDDLDLRSPEHLLASLERPPPARIFQRTADALDHQALAALIRRPHVRDKVRGPQATALLWQVCQVPDYRNDLTEAHVELLDRLHGWLSGPLARVPPDEIHRAVRRLDRVDGDIETLMARLAWIRTWTFISHREGWVDDAAGWRARTRAVEDRLSDALHEKLTQRFVDRRTRMEGGPVALGPARPPTLEADGTVQVLGTVVGQVRGLSFVPDPRGLPAEEPDFERALRRLLAGPIAARLDELLAAEDPAFTVTADGTLRWEEIHLGQLQPGREVLDPRIRTLRLDLLDDEQRARVQARLLAWRQALVQAVRAPLSRPPAAALGRPGRGLLFQILEGLGSAPMERLAPLWAEVGEADRRNLARLGLRLGRHHAYAVDLLLPPAVRARATLWAVFHGRPVPAEVPTGASAPRPPGLSSAQALAMGYALLGPRLVRHDMLERVDAWARQQARAGPFALEGPALDWLGCPKAEAPDLFRALGYRPVDPEGRRWAPAGRRHRPAPTG